MSALLAALVALFSLGFAPGPSAHAETVPTALRAESHGRIADPTPDLPEARPEATHSQPTAQLPLVLGASAPVTLRPITFAVAIVDLSPVPLRRWSPAALGARAPPLA